MDGGLFPKDCYEGARPGPGWRCAGLRWGRQRLWTAGPEACAILPDAGSEVLCPIAHPDPPQKVWTRQNRYGVYVSVVIQCIFILLTYTYIYILYTHMHIYTQTYIHVCVCGVQVFPTFSTRETVMPEMFDKHNSISNSEQIVKSYPLYFKIIGWIRQLTLLFKLA